MAQSIIDRDIAFYEGEVETLKTELRRCAPADEAFTRRKIESARAVVAALLVHRFRIGGEV